VNRRRLGRFYDRLTAEERFRLVIAASGRDDLAEEELLFRTCPRCRYEAPDARFHDRFMYAERVVVATLLELVPILTRRDLLRELRPAIEFYNSWALDEAAYAAHLVLPEDHEDEPLERILEGGARPRERLRSLLDRLDASLETEAASLARGFGEFARDELGVEPLDLIVAFAAPLAPTFEELLDAAPVPERVIAFRQMLTATSRRYLGLQPEPSFPGETPAP
jgi:hypothetical protein